jgi:poly-gamma-glutamate synthesis protein (capsule biosynthesis protein)
MTGRGIDQILPHAGDPRLVEPYVKDAGEYVALAESANGPVPRPVREGYVWGDALEELAHAQPRARVVNLETAVTVGDGYWPGKGIHYRMHPANAGCLTAARIDVCTLANNHVLDFGAAGLLETLDTLAHVGIRSAGAGADLEAARAPAALDVLPGSRLVVFAFGMPSSGIPDAWGAGPGRSGVDLVTDLSNVTADAIAARVSSRTRARDIALVSIHWGDNWGYDVPAVHRRFAHRLIDGGVDIVHGHSSHHPRPIEIYRNRLILYGCGDLINDYEGISGYEQFRDDLTLMYFPTVSTDTGELIDLRLVPMQLRRLRLTRPSAADGRWLRDSLARASTPFGTRIELAEDGSLTVGPVR